MLSNIQLNENNFINLLEKLIGVAENLQNAPSLGLIPQEDLASDHILEALNPYLIKNGGNISVERIAFKEKRGHVIIKYIGKKENLSLSFIGSHLDVVPANPESWERDPFKLNIEGDKLYGRGTTDCLGHVALITQLFIELAKNNIQLNTTISAVFIASEENTEIQGVGIDMLMKSGKIDFIKNGPVIWVDCADSEPCIGTAGVITWTLKASGKLFHSGLPHLGINGLELGMDAIKEIQKRFYKDFPPHEREKEYNFACSSTIKPTNIQGSVNGLNQIPPWVKISGDVRLSPFYEMEDVKRKMVEYVNDINLNIKKLESRGPHSKYTLEKENTRGKIELTFEEHYLEGIACSLDSRGYRALVEATKHVAGKVTPFAIMGSLPLVRDLQRSGFDLILAGFGKSSVYHGDNEYCLLSDMKNAIKILARVIENIENEI